MPKLHKSRSSLSVENTIMESEKRSGPGWTRLFLARHVGKRLDPAWQEISREAERLTQEAEDGRKIAERDASNFFQQLINIRYLKVENDGNGPRQKKFDELFSYIARRRNTREASDTVESLVDEYWEVLESHRSDREDNERAQTQARKEIGKLKRDLAEEKENREQDRRDSEGVKRSLELQNRQLQTKFESLRAKSERDMDTLQRNHDSHKRQLVASHEDAIKDIRRRHRTEKEDLNAAHTTTIVEARDRHEKEKLAMNRRTAEKESIFAEEIQQLKGKHANDILAWQNQHRKQETRLRSDIEALNGALLAREAFNPATDHELQAPFLDLLTDLGQLVRVTWDTPHPDWTNDLLGRLAKNQKMIRRQVVQDGVWMILNKNIFCSPFRVFGAEGARLEAQWKRAFPNESQDAKGLYNWPAPTLDSERWRYNSITPCQEALTKPVSDVDAMTKIKNGYENTLEQTKEELLEMLGTVANLDDVDEAAWSEIPKKAADMWISMGTQRCRLVVVVPGGERTAQAERARKARDEGLELVIKPELRRYGDSKGQDLGRMEEMVVGETKLVPDVR